MDSSLRRPDPLVFDSVHAERWHIFKVEFGILIDAAHPAAAPHIVAVILLDVVGTEAALRAQDFNYASEHTDPVTHVVTPA